MKKTISVLLAIMMIMLSLLPTMVLAEERDKTYDVTLGEIQQELIDYASIAGSKIVPGTDSYYDYVVNQLLNHSDQKLCEHPHYDLIHAYRQNIKLPMKTICSAGKQMIVTRKTLSMQSLVQMTV